MMSFGFKGLLVLLAVVLFIVGALSDENKLDLLYWGLAIFAASFLVDSLPLGNMMGQKDRDRA